MSNISWRDADTEFKQDLYEFLWGLVTEQKRRLMDEVLSKRTRYITVVLEDIYDPHNAGAVVRSCDCFGVQDIHVIEGRNRFRPNSNAAAGAARWVSVTRYPRHTRDDQTDPTGIRRCLLALKSRGYRLAATTLREGAVPIQELPLTQKVALCFGAEETGLSDTAHELADMYAQLPMVGFTQSLNVSVTAALCLHELTNRLRASGEAWPLSHQEKIDLKIEWMLQLQHRRDSLLRGFFKRRGRPDRS